MFEQDMVGTLAFATIGIVLVIAAIVLIRFLAKPRNRHPLPDDATRNHAEMERDAQRNQPHNPIR
jgi:hypothetical protein